MEAHSNKALDENKKLKLENVELTKERDSLIGSKADFEKSQREIAQFMIEQQANADEIKDLYEKGEQQQDQFEKIKLEVTVIMAEKVTFQRELERVQANYLRMQRGYNDMKVHNDLL